MPLLTTPCIERVGHGFTTRETYLAWARVAIQDRGIARTVAQKLLDGGEPYPWNAEDHDVYETFAVSDRCALEAQLGDEDGAANAETANADREMILRVVVDHRAGASATRTIRADYMTPTALLKWLGITWKGPVVLERLRQGIPLRDRRGEEDVYLIAASAVGHPQPAAITIQPGAELRELYDQGCRGAADVDMDELLWRIFADVHCSYRLALNGAGIAEATITEAAGTVEDYLANRYGSR
jgi:hypothetical protein